jgi:hypothetical protein
MAKETKSKQIQKATNGYQAGGNITINDTNIFVELLKNTEERLRAEYNLAIAKQSFQLEKFTTLIIPRLTREEYRKAFEQPDYLLNVTEAQRSAIRTDSEDDLLLLADILERRAQISQPTPRHKMATRKALNVVGQLSQEDLDTLTLLWYGLYMTPDANIFEQSISSLNQHISPFVDGGIPKNDSWMADLDILDCINVSSGGQNHLKSFAQLVAENKYPGYFALGMEDEEANNARILLKSIKPGLENLVINHPITPNRFLLLGASEEHFRKIVGNNIKLTKARTKKVDDVVSLNNYPSKINDHTNEAKKAMSKHRVLEKLNNWWDESKLPVLSITPVGIVLAYSNFHKELPAVGCPSLPSLLGGN